MIPETPNPKLETRNLKPESQIRNLIPEFGSRSGQGRDLPYLVFKYIKRYKVPFLSLSLTHTHTCSLARSLPPSLSRSLSLSLPIQFFKLAWQHQPLSRSQIQIFKLAWQDQQLRVGGKLMKRPAPPPWAQSSHNMGLVNCYGDPEKTRGNSKKSQVVRRNSRNREPDTRHRIRPEPSPRTTWALSTATVIPKKPEEIRRNTSDY